jgi:hypothetical protein
MSQNPEIIRRIIDKKPDAAGTNSASRATESPVFSYFFAAYFSHFVIYASQTS